MSKRFAFPKETMTKSHDGMTLREYFAGQAIVGVMSNIQNIDKTDYVGLIGSQAVARICADLADDLITELSKDGAK